MENALAKASTEASNLCMIIRDTVVFLTVFLLIIVCGWKKKVLLGIGESNGSWQINTLRIYLSLHKLPRQEVNRQCYLIKEDYV